MTEIQSPSGVRNEAGAGHIDARAWRTLAHGGDAREAASVWLRLYCERTDGVRNALLLLRDEGGAPLRPLAVWPSTHAVTKGLRTACESAIAKDTGVLRRGQGEVYLALPCTVGDSARAVVGCTLEDRADRQFEAAMADLQLCSGWLEALLRRAEAGAEEERAEVAAEALELMACVVDEPRFEGGARALVTDLAIRFDCERVSLAMLRRGRPRVVAMSHAATFSRRMDLVSALEGAIEESLDQQTPMAWPLLEGEQLLVTRAHEALARAHGAGAVLTVPLMHGEEVYGALVLEATGREKLTHRLTRLLEGAGALLAPVLREKQENDRWLVRKVGGSLALQTRRLFGPDYLGRKAAAAAVVALAAFAWFAEGTATIVADARLEGRVQRAIVAPFDGYVLSESARAGQVVEAGERLAALDDRDLRLERLRYEAGREQRELEMQKALAEGRRADINVVRAKIREATAQIELLDEMIRRARLKSPFDGLVVSGDLSQKVGTPVGRGDQLFQITPLEGYRVVLSVPEDWIAGVEPGQDGRVRFAAFPQRTWPVSVESITPVTEVREGKNVFRVEARIGGTVERLRPGMEGVVRLTGEEERLVAIWLRPAVDWLRLTFWRWLP